MARQQALVRRRIWAQDRLFWFAPLRIEAEVLVPFPFANFDDPTHAPTQSGSSGLFPLEPSQRCTWVNAPSPPPGASPDCGPLRNLIGPFSLDHAAQPTES